MGLEIVTFYNKDKKEFLKIDFKNSKLEQI